MKLTRQDIEMFKSLNLSGTGKWLAEYISRLNQFVLDPETLSAENVEARKEAIRIMKSHILDRIQMANVEVSVSNETE